MQNLQVALASSEVHPFSKTGGLADVSSALVRYLSAEGHDVRLFTPLYSSVDRDLYDLTPVSFLQNIELDLGGVRATFSVLTAPLPETDVSIYFIDCPRFYDRGSIYTGDPDEHLRFLLLSRALFECCQRMGWSPHILHGNDWPTAVVPLLKISTYGWDSLFHRSRTVLTIHNIGYQGLFSSFVAPAVVADEHQHFLHQDDLRAGMVNFLKTGILFANALTTVSPTYAHEIQFSDLGAGLQDLLFQRHTSVSGILNGVDYSVWSPDNDPWIAAQYNARNPVAGKRTNKEALLKEFGLPCEEGVPLIGVISRLVGQKGFEICFDALPRLLEKRSLQLVVLGSGEDRYQDFFSWLAQRFTHQVGYYRGYSDSMAHLIEAGADLFLMPSRYEPCGLNQMYSLKYGTVPIVRKTGGLADSVIPFDPATGEGTGFVFEHFNSEAVEWAIETALATYSNRAVWLKLMRNGMAQDFSWESQVHHYIRLYRSLLDD